jgi:hypothetical protein
MSHSENNNQQIGSHPKLLQMLELANKDIKIILTGNYITYTSEMESNDFKND